jgi:CheY-like chemotaxis protein
MAKILLVDDSRFQRNYVSKMLVRMGHEVITAENGQLGLEMAKSETPDMIITDILMPVMDGISLLRGLKEQHSQIPAVVASADIQKTTRAECLELGALDFMTKPVKRVGLEAAIIKALGVSSEEASKC